MRKILLSSLISVVAMNAATYQSVIEPLNLIKIQSEVSGKIISLDRDLELRNFSGEIIQIEDTLELKKLKNLESKLALLKDIEQIKASSYNKIKKLEGKNINEKNSYLVDLLNIQMQIDDIENSIVEIKHVINKKKIVLKDKYIKEINFNKGEYVTPGATLLTVEDQSKSKLVIYVDKEDRKKLISSKKFFVNNDSNHSFKINKISNSTDSNYISLYKVELISSKVKDFGSVLSVRIGEEKKLN